MKTRFLWGLGVGIALLGVGGVAVFRAMNAGGEKVQELPVTQLQDGVFRIAPESFGRTMSQLQRPEAILLPAIPRETSTPVEIATTDYMGAQVCGECHAEYVASAARTAHANTAGLPTEESVLGSFASGKSIVRTGNPGFWFQMTKQERDLLQTVILERGGKRYSHTEKIDYVTGSGKLGQTYLYWSQDALYELPVSYFTDADQWVNSPGYRDATANFARPVEPACLRCHATWIQHISGSVNRFVAEGALLGISCERCHGPGREHVQAQRGEPIEGAAADPMINPASLPRDRQLELCSQCHAGTGRLLRPPFSYRPGEALDEYIQLSNTGTSGPGGVHSANQRARLSLSSCFQASDTMTCTTCHDPHRHERGQQAIFIERCLSCHGAQDCGIVRTEGAAWEQRCIDCHMPLREDTETVMHGSDKSHQPMLRDHYITVDDAITRKILAEQDE